MFAALSVPDFALQCVLRREPELRARALAIVDGGLPARVRQVTAAARDRGVAAGMTTTQALGRCPSLLFRTPGSLAAESACLLQCAETFSPWLEATGEGVVTLEWRGHLAAQHSTPNTQHPTSNGGVGPAAASLGVGCSVLNVGCSTRLRNSAPNGPPHSAHAIVSQLAVLGFTAGVGLAANPDLALLAAYGAMPVRLVEDAADFLAPLPLEVLSADAAKCSLEVQSARDESFRLLHRWGIRTLGAFAALPRDQVVARLGGVAAELWDRATGRANRPLRLVRAPEGFVEGMELEHAVETLEPLLFILHRFLEQLAARLSAAYRVAATLSLRLRFATGAAHEREFRIPAPTCNVEMLFRLVETHLETLTAESPIIAVELHARPALAEQKQCGLFESGLRDPNQFFQTLARLHALLGNARAGTPVVEDTYRPDTFHLETPRFDEPATAVVAATPTGPALQRYRPPLPADVQVCAGRPVRVFSEKAFGEICDCRGPWRSSGDWWDNRAWEREEWDVEVRGDLYRLARQGGVWFLDGAYD